MSAFGGRAGRARSPALAEQAAPAASSATGSPAPAAGRRATTGNAGLAGPAVSAALGGNAGAGAALVKLLETGAPGYKWAAATVGSDSAASMELSTGGDPVMAIGGFSGSDPAPTLAEFQRMIAAHQVHYFVAGGGVAGGFARGTGGIGAGARGGVGTDSAQITSWVEAHFTAQAVGGETVYDLAAPDAAS